MEKKRPALEDVRQLAQKMHSVGLQEIEWRGTTWSVRLRHSGVKTQPEPSALLPPAAAEPSLLPVCAPLPGRLLLAHPDRDEAFVREGQNVRQGEILALVQIGALYLPVCSSVAGVVSRIIAGAGDRLEYGSEIALLLPDGSASAR